MKSQNHEKPLVFLALVVFSLIVVAAGSHIAGASGKQSPVFSTAMDVQPLPAYASRGLEWLVEAQFENGGWGAGQHSAQGVRDPHAVKIDPATTAFAAMALVRAGSTTTTGPYHANVRRALDYLLGIVEASPENSPRLTQLSGTQPQAKLGENIDVSMVAQFLSRVLPTIEEARLKARVESSLDKCVRKIESAQLADGSWNQAGWAPVLQSAVANSALEAAAKVGRRVDKDVLGRSREYQKNNVDAETGTVRTEAAAGVSLYSIASNQRATAPEASEARDKIEEAKRAGILGESEEVTLENLEKAGYSNGKAGKLFESYQQNEATKRMLADDRVLSGFGNNGGEEFLSYMMTSESLIVTGDEEWKNWYNKMNELFGKVQNQNGSWSGHHCITSPVFCTAAVLLTITADRDADLLRNAAQG